MSLKAGRVGVHPADVDPVSGHISASSSEGYTKTQADDKFLAKNDASSTYLSKSDASSTYESKADASIAHNLLQPKQLALPIEMLDGTKLTVESALQSLNGYLDDTLVWKGIVDSTGDLNDYISTGIYAVEGAVLNIPPDMDSTYSPLLVINAKSLGTRQILLRGAAMIYERTYGGSPVVWSNWYKYAGTEITS